MRVVCVPGTLALLPEYAAIEDPIPELRKAVAAAVAWLLEEGGARVLPGALPSGERIGRHLLGPTPDVEPVETPTGLLVIANGSAMRTQKAPGHFDVRAEEFDRWLGKALRAADSQALADIDESLAGELWADVEALRSLGSDVDLRDADVHVDYDDAPYGVQYWVARWQISKEETCGS